MFTAVASLPTNATDEHRSAGVEMQTEPTRMSGSDTNAQCQRRLSRGA
jgi:hypothetical protein